MQIKEDILPIGEFKTHASRLLRKLHETQRPIVITQNGRPAGVLITPAEFDRLRHQEQSVAAVAEGLAGSETGRTIGELQLDAEPGLRPSHVSSPGFRGLALEASSHSGPVQA